MQGPKGELAWTFVPEVTLKEVCGCWGAAGYWGLNHSHTSNSSSKTAAHTRIAGPAAAQAHGSSDSSSGRSESCGVQQCQQLAGFSAFVSTV